MGSPDISDIKYSLHIQNNSREIMDSIYFIIINEEIYEMLNKNTETRKIITNLWELFDKTINAKNS